MKRTMLLMVLLAAPLALANPNPGEHPRGQGPGPLDLFSPEMVMKARTEIGLTDAQSTAIREAMQRTQGEVTGYQWDLGTEAQKLHELVSQPVVDADAAAAQLDRVLAMEAKVKKAHLKLALLIKAQLTPEQQGILRRKQMPGPQMGRPPAGPAPRG